MQPGEVEGGEPRQRTATGRKLLAGVVEKAHPERLEHPRTAVGRGAAADPEDHLGHPGVQGRGECLSDPATRGRHRLEPGREPDEPARVGHLDDGDSVAHGVGRLDDLPGRAVDLQLDPLVAGGEGGLEGAVAPVRDDDGAHVALGVGPVQPLRDVGQHLTRRERPLELVARDEHMTRAGGRLRVRLGGVLMGLRHGRSALGCRVVGSV